MALSYKDVADIIKVIDASQLDEVVLELPDVKLVIRRGGAGGHAGGSAPSAPSAPMASAPAPKAAVPVAPAAATSPRPAASGGARNDGAIEVRAPMVGTFYRAPSPKDKAFVEVGTVVKPGQALGLIEVMKLYTTIEAKQGGRVVEIPVANGTLVEYDQVLFVIEPAG